MLGAEMRMSLPRSGFQADYEMPHELMADR